MHMICNYEEIKTEIVKNNYQSLRNITFQFHECNSIELQKKILILLLKRVRKAVLKRYAVLGEYNFRLIKINPNKLKEEIHEFLYSMYNNKDVSTTFILSNISVARWKSITFSGQTIKSQGGYVFLDLINLVFYSPIENFVIDIQSVLSVKKDLNLFVLLLKGEKEFSFELTKDTELFEMKLRETFKVEEIKGKDIGIQEALRDIKQETDEHINNDISLSSQTESSSLNFNYQILNENQKNRKIEITETSEMCLESHRQSLNDNIPFGKLQDRSSPIECFKENRTSLNQKKLVFNSECVSNFGKNLQIRIKKPKKELFSNHPTEEFEAKMIFPNTEELPKIKKEKAFISNKEKTIKKPVSKKRNFTVHMKKFITRITKSKLRNLKQDVKEEVKRIKQRGRAIKSTMKVFVNKYISTIKYLR